MFHAACGLLLLATLLAGQVHAQVVLSPTNYDLNIEVEFDEEILRGTAGITLENAATEPVHEASLLLYRLLRVQAVHDKQGHDLDFRQSVVAFEDFGQLQVNQIVIPFAEPLSPGAAVTLQLQYGGYLLGYSETGMLYIQDRIAPEFTILREDSYAYPQPGYPSRLVNRGAAEWNFSYLARITVPKEYTVANGGRLVACDTLGEKRVFQFASLKPSWRMDFAIAHYTRMTSGIIHVYYLPGDKEGAAGVAAAAQRSFDLYTSWFGPLRGTAGLTFIEIPDGWGSQADVSTIIQSAAAFQDPERHHEVYHEISHLWNVSPTDRPSPRWNEGLATFLENLVDQEISGRPEVDARTTQLIDWLVQQLPDHPRWSKVPMVDYGREGLTDLSYSVGAVFFDLLYRLAGRDTFNAIVGRYYANYQKTGGSTEDFATLAIEVADAKYVSKLFHDWVFTTSWADRIVKIAGIEELVKYYREDGSREGTSRKRSELKWQPQEILSRQGTGHRPAATRKR